MTPLNAETEDAHHFVTLELLKKSFKNYKNKEKSQKNAHFLRTLKRRVRSLLEQKLEIEKNLYINFKKIS